MKLIIYVAKVIICLFVDFFKIEKNIVSTRNYVQKINTPRGIRIPVTSVKGKCPRPLDDGGSFITI